MYAFELGSNCPVACTFCVGFGSRLIEVDLMVIKAVYTLAGLTST